MTPAPLPADADIRIAVIGLGYVGLPLAVEFGRTRPVIGFDIDAGRIAELARGMDRTREVPPDHLAAARHLELTSDAARLAHANVFIVTVPTPIDSDRRPDLRPLLSASATVGRAMARGAVVIFESTVYPGATEEDCRPVLERESGLAANVDFYLGYSPERINPGDPTRRLPTICKVTSGSTPEAAAFVDRLYASIITAGTHRAGSIRVAEAAKVIENTQRDLNIALVNELAIIFDRMGIDTEEVLRAAGTKWNFLPFRPGLVGGHCIGVDPYYLTYKAERLGYHPQIILAGRRLNDGMGAWVAARMVKAMLKRRIQVDGARVLVLGLTFKENCPDLRNTRVIDLVAELRDFGAQVDVHDPLANPREAMREYGLELVAAPEEAAYDGIVLAVAHAAYADWGAGRIRAFGRNPHVLYDLKHLLPAEASDLRL